MPPRRARILPFPPSRGSTPPGGPPPRPRPAGVVATLSIDAKEVARLVARDLADEWVKGVKGGAKLDHDGGGTLDHLAAGRSV